MAAVLEVHVIACTCCILQMWNSGWTLHNFLLVSGHNGRSNCERCTACMRGITAPPVHWLWIQFWWQFILCLGNFHCHTAALDAIDTLKLCRGCSCVTCHTYRVNSCRGLCTQGGVNVVLGIFFISTVPVATSVRCCVCSWTCATTTQFRCPAPDAPVLVLSLKVPCASILVHFILVILPWNNQSQYHGTSKETPYTLHAFLKVGKNFLCIEQEPLKLV